MHCVLQFVLLFFRSLLSRAPVISEHEVISLLPSARATIQTVCYGNSQINDFTFGNGFLAFPRGIRGMKTLWNRTTNI